jgi:hypothetical protein
MNDNLMVEHMSIQEISSMFNKLIHEEDDINENEKKCYISGERLSQNYVTLPCDHTFNYISLFNEVKNQKIQKSSYNIIKLRVNQLQCPYCRTIHNHILPKLSNVDKVFGVNYPEYYTMKPDTCGYLFKSGARKNTVCGKPCFGKFCKAHERYNKVYLKEGCKAILKSGKNKGCKCNCSIYKEGYCKRHLKNIEK